MLTLAALIGAAVVPATFQVTVCVVPPVQETAVLGAVTNPGDTVCAEALAYPGFRAAASQLGLAVLGLEMDAEGIVPAALARACRDVGPRALCCTPTFQNPTTATMSEARRREIVAIARRHRLRIVEDDAYGKVPEQSPPALAVLAPDLTWHIAGLAKLASPATFKLRDEIKHLEESAKTLREDRQHHKPRDPNELQRLKALVSSTPPRQGSAT